ncbi:hypothetical protein MCC10100_0418 [Bifidobacterium longum subsp. longum]|uniref:Uncharacterized protein n=1 Tax=Bifidobacterium longum subsp. longum TaxID=1679 RepID=A0A4R0USV5_BIFLL|nr:hypothetical protein MCC10100_0418 [Bifidobacterium longum subsp. longum]
MGLLSVSSTISCSSRAMEGATGVRLGGWRRIMPFLFSRLTVDACRPGIMAMRRTLAPLPISIRMTYRSSSDRCEYTWPKAQHPSVWLSGQSPI